MKMDVKLKRFSGIMVAIIFLIMIFIVVMKSDTSVTSIKAAEQQMAQTCSSSGILLRSDGSVIVDGWKDYSGFSRMTAPNMPPSSAMEAKDAPSSIMLGKNLIDKTLICFEDNTGSRCVALEQLRKVK